MDSFNVNLFNEMEREREKLMELLQTEKTVSGLVIRQSQKLDTLILQYHKTLKHRRVYY